MTAQFYQDRKKQWRWRLRARNGRVVAIAGEGYRRAVDAKRGLFVVLNHQALALEGYPSRRA